MKEKEVVEEKCNNYKTQSEEQQSEEYSWLR